MAEPQDPNAAMEMRASDSDRELVADRLREAAGHGRLTMDELEERIELAYAARTYAELEPLTRDLPGPGTTALMPAAATGTARARIGGSPGRRWSIAIMSGSTRRGRWVVPRKYTAFAFWGGVVIDLRDANFAEQETVIRASAIMGGIEIIAPPDVDVRVEGFGLMGGYDDSSSRELDPPPLDAPIVRVTGIAFWAGVDVQRKAPKNEPKTVEKGSTPGELTS